MKNFQRVLILTITITSEGIGSVKSGPSEGFIITRLTYDGVSLCMVRTP